MKEISPETVPGGSIQSVLRALAILEFIAAAPTPPRAQAIARAVQLQLTTAHHLLSTLVYAGYLIRDGRNYHISGKLNALASALSRDLRIEPAALTAAHQLAAATGETAYVSRWYLGDVTIAGLAEGQHAVRVTGLHIGMRGNAHARASGKVLFAFAPAQRLEDYLAANAPLPRRTPQTVTDPDQLRREIAEVRERGYAVDRGEFIPGVCGIAAPLLEPNGFATACLAVTVPAHRLDDTFDHALRAVLEAARLGSSIDQRVA
jgi:DNA-binding IclR family transcriptional regulator